MRKPRFSYVQSGPLPAKAGPSKTAWDATEARLETPALKKQVSEAQRRAERFAQKLQTTRGTSR